MSPNRGLAVGVLALLTFASALVAQAPAVAQQPTEPAPVGSVGIRLLEAPVSLQDDPRAMAYIIDNLPPGTTVTRRIEVSNSSDQEQPVTLYPAAASIGAGDGGFEVGDDRAVNELTTWMSVAPTDITLAPNSAAEAVVTIAVPPDAPEGEQYAVVWAQTAAAPTGTGIQNVSRVGIRTYLSVGPGNGPPADLEIGDVTAARSDSGAPEVRAEVTNTGGRALDPSGTVELSRWSRRDFQYAGQRVGWFHRAGPDGGRDLRTRCSSPGRAVAGRGHHHQWVGEQDIGRRTDFP